MTAALLAITAIAGVLFGALGLYTRAPPRCPRSSVRTSSSLSPILPLLLWSVWAARCGSTRGLQLWTAVLFYLAYSYAYYVLNPEFNVLYLAYIAIVAMSLYGCVYLLLSTDLEAVSARLSRRTPSILLAGSSWRCRSGWAPPG